MDYWLACNNFTALVLSSMFEVSGRPVVWCAKDEVADAGSTAVIDTSSHPHSRRLLRASLALFIHCQIKHATACDHAPRIVVDDIKVLLENEVISIPYVHFNTLTPTCHMDTAVRHRVQDRVKLSFVIFDIRALW